MKRNERQGSVNGSCYSPHTTSAKAFCWLKGSKQTAQQLGSPDGSSLNLTERTLAVFVEVDGVGSGEVLAVFWFKK